MKKILLAASVICIAITAHAQGGRSHARSEGGGTKGGHHIQYTEGTGTHGHQPANGTGGHAAICFDDTGSRGGSKMFYNGDGNATGKLV